MKNSMTSWFAAIALSALMGVGIAVMFNYQEPVNVVECRSPVLQEHIVVEHMKISGDLLVSQKVDGMRAVYRIPEGMFCVQRRKE